MSRVWDKKFRLTLWGVDGEPVALSRPGRRREGIFLEDVPDGLSGFGKNHIWDDAAGVWRGMRTDTNSIKLDVLVKSRDVRGTLDRFLTSLGDGSKPLGLSVTSAEHGYRWLRVRPADVSTVKWFQSPGGARFAKVAVQLELVGAATRRFTDRVELDSNSEFGKVSFRIDGDQDVWPKFTITGQHEGVKIRLTAADEWQELPHTAEGWAIDSHPQRRHVTDRAGRPDFSMVVPFWPMPVENRNHVGEVEVQATRPGDDFKLTIEWIPEFSRAW